MTVLEKQPSPELLSLIKAAAQSLLGFGELWNSIKMKGKDEGFSEKELQDILRPLLKPQLNKDQIYYLFNAEQRKENSKDQHRRHITTNAVEKVIEQRTIPEELPPNAPTKTSEQFYKEQEEQEEPTELELLKIENEQLKDALHKTEQFKPATALEGKRLSLDETAVFDWLGKRDDKIKCFYFGSCGTGFLKANILKNLENSGIKTFKRLYFEV